MPIERSADANNNLVNTPERTTAAAFPRYLHGRVLADSAALQKAAEGRPALGASLNISGGNIGIALGAFIGSRVIDLFGLASVGLAGAVIIVAAALGLNALF